MISAPSAEIWDRAGQELNRKRRPPGSLGDDNQQLLAGCPCPICKRVRQLVRERYTFDTPNLQFGVTLALAETWRTAPPARYQRGGTMNTCTCSGCCGEVTESVARWLGRGR